MQGGPQVFILQVDIQASLDQKLGHKHVVMTSTLQGRACVHLDNDGVTSSVDVAVGVSAT